jgi:SAM-dependent methyltransferase
VNRNCPLCNFDNSTAPATRYSRGLWLVKVCGQCSFVYLENPPDYKELQTQWPWEKTAALEAERRLSAEPMFQRLALITNRLRCRMLRRDKLIPLALRFFSPGAVMDVGCGGGGFLRRLGEAGFMPYGVEISDALAKRALPDAAAFGGRVVVGNAMDGLDQFSDGTFAGAILISFLEHESHPLPLLVKLCRKLVAGGRMILKVPNFGCWNRAVRHTRWCGFRFPDHVNYFTPRTLRAMVRLAGFNVLRFSLRDRFPLSDNMWMVFQPA